MRKWFFKILILIMLASATGCLHAPRTAWTPKKYKKKALSGKAPRTRY